MNKYLILFLIILTIYNCESDDICPESTLTTPRLIVTFYDEENPEERKNIESHPSFKIVQNCTPNTCICPLSFQYYHPTCI